MRGGFFRFALLFRWRIIAEGSLLCLGCAHRGGGRMYRAARKLLLERAGEDGVVARTMAVLEGRAQLVNVGGGQLRLHELGGQCVGDGKGR